MAVNLLSLTLTLPSSDPNIDVGQSFTMRLTTTSGGHGGDAVNQLLFEYTSNGGTNWQLIGSADQSSNIGLDTAGLAAFTWNSATGTWDITVDGDIAGTYQVRGRSTGDDGPFTTSSQTVTVSGAASYSLDGSVTFTSTPNATFDLDVSLDGAVTHTWTPASTLAKTLSLSGDVTSTWTPAGSFAYAVSLTGDVTWSASVAASFAWARPDWRFDTPIVTGGYAFDRGFEVTASSFLAGDVTFTATPGSSMVFAAAFAGDVTTTWTPSASFNFDATFAGDVAATFTPASSFGFAGLLTGDVAVTWTPSASFALSISYSGDVTLTWTPSASFNFGQQLNGDVTLTWTPAASFSFDGAIAGDVTATWTPASSFALSISYPGDATLTWTPSASFEFGQQLSGDVSWTVIPSSSLLAAFVFNGDALWSVAPSSSFAFIAEDAWRFDNPQVAGSLSFVFDDAKATQQIQRLDGSVSFVVVSASTMLSDKQLQGDAAFVVTPGSSFNAQDIIGSAVFTVTPASTLPANTLLQGDVLWSVSVASSFEYQLSGWRFDSPVIGGSVVIFDDAKQITIIADLEGSTAWSMVPAASSLDVTQYLSPSLDYYFWPASSMSQNASSLQGSVTFTVTPQSIQGAETRLDGQVFWNVEASSSMNGNVRLDGGVTFEWIPVSIFNGSFRLDGDVTFTFTPDSTMGERLDGDVTFTVTPASSFEVGDIYFDGAAQFIISPQSRMFADVIVYDENVVLQAVRPFSASNPMTVAALPAAIFNNKLLRIMIDVRGDALDETNGVSVAMNYQDPDISVGDLEIYSSLQKNPRTLLYENMDEAQDNLIFTALRDKLNGPGLSLVLGSWRQAANEDHAFPINLAGPITVRVIATGQ